MRRLLLGFLIAPAAGALLPLAWGLTYSSPWESVLLGGAMGLWVSYHLGLPIGILIYFIMRWRKWASLRAYFLAGLVGGISIFEVTWSGIIALSVSQFRWGAFALIVQETWQLELMCGFSGAISAMAFWFIAGPSLTIKSHSAA